MSTEKQYTAPDTLPPGYEIEVNGAGEYRWKSVGGGLVRFGQVVGSYQTALNAANSDAYLIAEKKNKSDWRTVDKKPSAPSVSSL